MLLTDIGNDLLSNDWANFMNVMDDAHATFNQKRITWLRQNTIINRFQEDQPKPTDSVELKVLLNYNFKRSWPINVVSESGEEERQSIQVMINKRYLGTNSLLDENGNFIYNEDYDRFIIDGVKYKSLGDTSASAIDNNNDIFWTIVVRRIQKETD
jgi:hypothetical protein